MNKKQQHNFISELELVWAVRPATLDEIKAMFQRHAAPAPKIARIRNTKAPQLRSLFQWEADTGSQLCPSMLSQWIRDKEFCPVLIKELIEEFRLEMISKNKQYADFKATFQTYVNKGYLSKKVGQLALANSPHKSTSGVTIHTRGVRI